MSGGTSSQDTSIEAQKLWEKYEEIAMHFNDLLMRLRSQSLAGIAALSALVGIFTKEVGPSIQLDWLIAEALFSAMALFWVAIWCLDLLYYNRLLAGAVKAIRQLESQTGPNASFDGTVNMSTVIEAEFSEPLFSLKSRRFLGVVAFYVIVFMVIVMGGLFSAYMRGDLSALLPSNGTIESKISAYNGVAIGSTIEETEYRLGYPDEVLGDRHVNGWRPLFYTDRERDPRNAMPVDKDIRDFSGWVYSDPGQTGEITISFDHQQRVASVRCASQNTALGKPCPPVRNIAIGSSEEAVRRAG